MGREAVSMSGCAVTAKSPKGSIFAVNWFGFGFGFGLIWGWGLRLMGSGGLVVWWFGGLEIVTFLVELVVLAVVLVAVLLLLIIS